MRIEARVRSSSDVDTRQHNATRRRHVDDGKPRTHPRHRARPRGGSRRGRGRSSGDHRVHALVRSADDEALARSAAEKAAVKLCFSHDVAEMARSLEAGAGVALLSDDMLDAGLAEFRRVLDRQERWSELPVIVVFDEEAPPAAIDALEEFELHARVKVMLLHRPVPVLSLASALRSALKSRERQYEVRNLLARLNKGVQLRDQYLAMLGHELRNPLSAIGYVAEIFGMSGESLSREQTRWGAEVISRQLRHLSRLLDQLLDVARVQRGIINLETVPVDLCAIARRCADGFDAARKGRDFALSVPLRPVPVSGDPLRLTQIVENLLDNAYKYTSDGGQIRVCVHADRDAVLTVSDNGEGITPSAMAHLFEPFFQEPRAHQQASRGLGLGLAVVENLTRLHGGTVTAASSGSGCGSEFELRLPLASDAERATASRSGASRKLRFLVIEDDIDSADALSMLLESLGHEARVAYDGSSGMRALEQLAFDLVLIDIGLPDFNGEELAHRLRNRLREKTPPLVALTGKVDSDTGRVFDEFLLKPIGREQVERLCGRFA
jgi:two-component system, sensor histidine kinase